MRNSFFFTFLALALAANLRADTKLYLLYESNCMAKHESWYTRSGVQVAGDAPLVQYALNPNRDTRVFLEMGGERPKTVDNMPKNTKSCSEIRWDLDLIREINNGKTDVFLIWKTNSGWSTATVATAALLNRSGSNYIYTDRDFNFKIDTAAAFQEDNMADRESNFFVSKKDFFYRECEPVYVLKREAKKACDAYTEFEFIPRYGIVQENTGNNSFELKDNQLNLYLVDGVNFIEKMKANCGTTAPAAVTYSYSTDYDANGDRKTVAATPVTYSQIDETKDKEMTSGGGYRANFTNPATETTVTSSCTAPEKVGYHLVQKGDNLYRIARQYGLSVSNLKTWNGLSKDDISACSYLAIDPNYAAIVAPKPVESNFVAQKTAIAQPKNESMTAGGGVRIIQSAIAPATYSTPSSPKPAHVVEVSTNGWHVIQPNENLTIIGAAYGLTATDLAKMNGIARNTILYPGQKLRTIAAAPAEKAAIAPEKTVVKPVVYVYEKPASPVTYQYVAPQNGCYHSILEGDNLSKIARTYGYTLERLMRMNGFVDEKMMLQVGQRILVNDCECLKKSDETSQSATDFTPKSVTGGGVAIHTAREFTADPQPVKPVVYEYESPVQPSQVRNIYTAVDGDTAPIVARKMNMDVNRFREINRLDVGEQLVPGQKLVVE